MKMEKKGKNIQLKVVQNNQYMYFSAFYILLLKVGHSKSTSLINRGWVYFNVMKII